MTPPVAPKWKQTDTLLDDFRKFKHSCQRIFDGPMCHITSGKVKTSMLLIWARPDGEDIYESFNLSPNQKNDLGYVIQHFEEFCEPICNFRAARFKFSKVFQHQWRDQRYCSTTGSLSCQNSVNFQIHMNA